MSFQLTTNFVFSFAKDIIMIKLYFTQLPIIVNLFLHLQACVLWTGSFPEMALMEVTLPGGFGADAQLLYSQLGKTSSRKSIQSLNWPIPCRYLFCAKLRETGFEADGRFDQTLF